MNTAHDVNLVQNHDVLQTRNEDIDEILRGEISAVESYEQLLEKFSRDPEAFRLRQFMSDHKRAVSFWKKESRDSGFIPEESSSIWGTAVEAFMGLSKFVGDDSALKAIRAGEEHGLSNYEKMLESTNLSQLHKDKIRNVFIPNQERHIDSINAMLKMN